MNPSDIERIQRLRITTTAPRSDDVAALLRAFDEAQRDCREWGEICGMISGALGTAFGKPPGQFVPMCFDDAIRELAAERDRYKKQNADLAAESQRRLTEARVWSGLAATRLQAMGLTRRGIEAIDPFQNSRENIAQRLQDALAVMEQAS